MKNILFHIVYVRSVVKLLKVYIIGFIIFLISFLIYAILFDLKKRKNNLKEEEI